MNPLQQRKSHTTIGGIYFWTATIHKWMHLLENDLNKQLIIDYLKKLSDEELITVFAFVIMPNHIHLVWQQNKLNEKETPKGSLLKYTGHEFLKLLKAEGKSNLYEVNAANKKHEIWQRDSLGIEIYSTKVAKQKLNYIHNNPVNGKWQLTNLAFWKIYLRCYMEIDYEEWFVCQETIYVLDHRYFIQKFFDHI